MLPRLAKGPASLLAFVCACNDSSTATTATTGSTGEDTGTSTGTTGTSSTGTGTSTGTSAPTTGDATSSGTTDPGFDPPVPACGNGYVEGDEECDDGNDVADDGCNNACLVPCGLETQVIALAPSVESDLWAVAVAPAPDGGFAVVARQREIISDQEGMTTIGVARTRVLRYGPDAAPIWDVLLAPADVRLAPAAGIVDADGDVYVAATLDGADEDDIRVVKLDGSDGQVLWTLDHDGAEPMGDDAATGLALAPDGDIIVAGEVSDVPEGADVWVRKLAAADGAEVWTATWTGAGNGQFSVDRGGPVAVAADGTVYVGAREYVEFNIGEAVLLKFPAGGGQPEWVFAPLADGSVHLHGAGWVAVDGAGDVLFSVVRQSGAVNDFWVYKLGPDKVVQWDRALADYMGEGKDWTLAGSRFDPDGGVVLSGSFRVTDKMAQLEWNEVWLARLDPDGATRCQIRHRAPSVDLLPPSLLALDTAVGADSVAHVAGQTIDAGEQQLWVGLFRPI